MRVFLTAITPLLLVAPLSAADGVRVEKVGESHEVRTAVYSAQVSAAGALVSLKINGVEFLAPSIEATWAGQKRLLPAVYACPMGQWYAPYKLPGRTAARDNVVRSEGNGWTLEYAFLPDAIDITYSGAPEGGRSFRAGYPPAELALSLSHDLDRACDAENQGELGWPVTRPHEPGNFAILARNGAGFIAEDTCRIQAVNDKNALPSPPNRLDLLVFNTYDQTPKPITHRLRLFKRADLARSLTMEIVSPNAGHIFSKTDQVVFPVKVSVLYGQSLKGVVAFDGAPYVWKKPAVKGKVGLELSGSHTTQCVNLSIRPPKGGHYTGKVCITDGQSPLYSKRIGFLYRPEEIAPANPPADFDAFWESTLAELAKIPLDMTLEPQTDRETAAGYVYKVKYRSWAGRWAWAWLYVPKAAGKVPAKVVCPPVSVWQPGQATPADGELRIAVAIHGGDLKDYPAKPDFDYMNTGITHRDTYMLRYSYCCLVRCFDIIRNHEKCNGEVLVQGGSQGAGLSLVLAGLRPVKEARGIAIALCRIDWTVLGYAQWGPACPAGQDPQKIAEVVRYYDPANFAHRIRTPLRLGLGLFDFCAPAEGIFTAINALPKETKCEVFVDPYGGHFSLNLPDFWSKAPGLEVLRWHGTAQDNKLVR